MTCTCIQKTHISQNLFIGTSGIDCNFKELTATEQQNGSDKDVFIRCLRFSWMQQHLLEQGCATLLGQIT